MIPSLFSVRLFWISELSVSFNLVSLLICSLLSLDSSRVPSRETRRVSLCFFSSFEYPENKVPLCETKVLCRFYPSRLLPPTVWLRRIVEVLGSVSQRGKIPFPSLSLLMDPLLSACFSPSNQCQFVFMLGMYFSYFIDSY